MKKIIMSFLIILASNSLALGQSKVSVNAGIGYPELINIGVQYYDTVDFGIGLGVGYFPLGNEDRAISIFGDLAFYFGKPSRISDRPLWFGKIGLSYHLNEDWNHFYDDPYTYSKSIFVILKIGRDIYFTERFGFKLELGGVFHHVFDSTLRSSSWFPSYSDFPPVLPALGVGFFYRL